MKMEQTECSETLAYKIQTPGNYREEHIQHVTGCFPSCKKYSLYPIYVFYMYIYLLHELIWAQI
jgi:hypothetical protein